MANAADKGLKVWMIFSIENNYDQPEHNLHWWGVLKPSIDEMAKILGYPLDKATDEEVVSIVSIWQGSRSRLGNTDYRLEEVKQGTL